MGITIGRLAQTPLMAAVEAGNEGEVNRLIAEGADVNQINKLGVQAVHWAAAVNQAQIISILANAKADLNTPSTQSGRSPLHYAVQYEAFEAAGVLASLGAADRDGVAGSLSGSYVGRRPSDVTCINASRTVWIEKLSGNGELLMFAGEQIRDDYEAVFAALCQAADPASGKIARLILKYASERLQRDFTLMALAGEVQFVLPSTKRLILFSKRFSKSLRATSVFSAIVGDALQNLIEPQGRGQQGSLEVSQEFERFCTYNPDIYDKGFCAVKPDTDGEIDWERAVDHDWPCRGYNCTKQMCLPIWHFRSGAPSGGSCWRYSFFEHEKQARDSHGFLAQIKEFNEQGVLELGKGQVIEEEMARSLGLPIFRFEQTSHDEIQITESNKSRMQQRVLAWLRETIETLDKTSPVISTRLSNATGTSTETTCSAP